VRKDTDAMPAAAFITGYVSVWMAWSAVVAARWPPQRATSLQMVRCLAIGACVIAPVVALALVSHCTGWIPPRINEMFTLMTPVMAAHFVAVQIDWTSEVRRGSVPF
jgi:hypothetical protein